MMTAALRDRVVLIDGPLQGRAFVLDATPTTPLEFHAAVAPDGTVLAVEGELAPVNQPHRPEEYRYEPVLAKDGVQSRGDDGFLRFYHAP